MAAIFLDTSALVRRYRPSEPGAAEVLRACSSSSGSAILIAQLAAVEVASALGRWVRDATLTLGEAQEIWVTFRGHCQDEYEMVALTASIVADAERLLFEHPLKAYDAVQIGSILAVHRDLPTAELEFWTADRQQAAAAARQALSVRLIASPAADQS